MRLSLRIGAAAALIVLGLIFLRRNFKTEGESLKDLWHFDTGSFRASLHPKQHQDTGGRRKWRVASDNKPALIYHTTDIVVPNSGAIVMAKLKEENTAWVSAELSE
jgi:hypothetical protein